MFVYRGTFTIIVLLAQVQVVLCILLLLVGAVLVLRMSELPKVYQLSTPWWCTSFIEITS